MADKILPQRVIITHGHFFFFVPHSYINCQTYISTARHLTPFIVSVLAAKEVYRCIFPHTQIRELVPESQAYMDLLAFERKLDQTIMRKRLDIQEALKRPIKVCFCPKVGFQTRCPGKILVEKTVVLTLRQYCSLICSRSCRHPV